MILFVRAREAVRLTEIKHARALKMQTAPDTDELFKGSFTGELSSFFPCVSQLLDKLKQDPELPFSGNRTEISFVGRHTQVHSNGENEIHVLHHWMPWRLVQENSIEYLRIFAVYNGQPLVEFKPGQMVIHQMYQKNQQDPDYFLTVKRSNFIRDGIWLEEIGIYRGRAPTPASWHYEGLRLVENIAAASSG